MNTVSRLQPILRPAARPTGPPRPTLVRVVVTEEGGAAPERITLAPGDRLVVENRTGRTLQVAPVDFFGTAFCRFPLEPGRASAPMSVNGLWFQVELLARGGRVYPLDVYLAPNGPA